MVRILDAVGNKFLSRKVESPGAEIWQNVILKKKFVVIRMCFSSRQTTQTKLSVSGLHHFLIIGADFSICHIRRSA